MDYLTARDVIMRHPTPLTALEMDYLTARDVIMRHPTPLKLARRLIIEFCRVVQIQLGGGFFLNMPFKDVNNSLIGLIASPAPAANAPMHNVVDIKVLSEFVISPLKLNLAPRIDGPTLKK